MSENSLSLSFSSSSDTSPNRWLKLSQYTADDPDSAVNLVDIDNMLLQIAIGQSAHSYLTPNCPITILEDGSAFYTAIIYVDHSVDLQYSISSNYGVLGPKVITSIPKTESLIIDGATRFELGWIPEDAEFNWESDTYINGIVTAPPDITLNDISLEFSYKVWGILRMTDTAVVDQYELVIAGREGYKLENFSGSVLATYTDDSNETAEEILDIKVPQCVEDLLTTCPDDDGDLSDWGIPPGSTGRYVHVWYDACDGHVIKIERSEYNVNR